MRNFSKKASLTKNITINFAEEIKNKILEEAKKQGISQGELVRLAVQQYLEYLDLMSQAENFGKLLEQDLIEE